MIQIEDQESVPEQPPPTQEKLHVKSKVHSNKTLERVEQETIDMQDSIEILKEHGISFLPNDESSVVANAVENGRSLAFTGKLVVNIR